LRTARDDPEHVERRFVGPMHVLDDHDDRDGPLQLADQRLGDLAAEHPGDVEKRPQRPRSEERWPLPTTASRESASRERLSERSSSSPAT